MKKTRDKRRREEEKERNFHWNIECVIDQAIKITIFQKMQSKKVASRKHCSEELSRQVRRLNLLFTIKLEFASATTIDSCFASGD